MLKKLLIVSILLVVVAAGGIAFAVYRADALARYFEPELERLASEATGSRVELEGLDISIFPKTALEIAKVSLSRSPKESLELQNFLLDIELLPLFSKRLEIVRVRLEKPSLTLIKDASGVHIAGLAPADKGTSAKRATDHADTKPARQSKPGAEKAGLSINLRELVLEDGKVTFRDTLSGKEHVVNDMDVRAALAIDEAVVRVPSFTVSGSVEPLDRFSLAGSNVSFEPGSGKLELPTATFTSVPAVLGLSGSFDTKAQSGKASLTSKSIDLERVASVLEKLSPGVAAYGLTGKASTDISATIAGPSVSASGKLNLSGVTAKAGNAAISDLAGDFALNGSLEEQKLASDNLTLRLNGSPVEVALKAGMRGKDVEVTPIAIKAFGGAIDGSAGFAAGRVSSDITLSNLDVAESLRALTGSEKSQVSGKLERSVVRLSGKPSPNELSGQVYVLLRDGRLEGQNLAASVLKGVTELPFVKGTLYGAASGEEGVERDGTVIRSLTGNFALAGGRAATKDFVLVSDIFELRAEGSVGVDTSVDMNATIYFEKGFSERLAGKIKELRKVLDRDGRLVIPLTLNGTPPKIVVVPNVAKLMQLGASQALSEEAGKAINKALGGRRGEGKKLIEGILGF